MKTETRAFRTHTPLPAIWEEVVVHLAEALGISLEIWTPASHHGQRLVLAPACVRCERDDARTFDRCRKRRAYLTRPEVEIPERLAEKCPRRVRLARRGVTGDTSRLLFFGFGHGADDAAGESDAGILDFLGDVRALSLPAASDPAHASRNPERDEAQTLFALARCRGSAGDTRHLELPALSAATELVAALVTALEARRPAQRGHALRVRLLALLIGREMGLAAQELEALHWAALLHGLSAIGTPGPDDGEACALDAAGDPGVEVRRLSTLRLLAGISGFDGVRAILHHHRAPVIAGQDPAGESLPAACRAAGCLAVADALDIVCAQRVPRRPRTLETAIAALASAAPQRFDSRAVAALQRLASQLDRHAWIFLLYRHGAD